MNKLKNIGISALAGTLVSLSAAQAGGVTVNGAWELSYTNLGHEEKVTGNKLGMKKNISFNASGDVSDGGGVTWATTIGGTDAMGLSSASMNINMGGIATLAYDSGTGGYGANAVDNIVPTAWEEIDYGFSTGITDLGMVSSSKGVVNLAIKAPTVGSGISVSYVSRIGGGHLADGAASDADLGRGRGMDIVVDFVDYNSAHLGFRFGAAGEVEIKEQTCANTRATLVGDAPCNVGHKNNPYGASAFLTTKLGPLHMGVQGSFKDPQDPTDDGIKNKRSIVTGVAFMVGDTLSVSYGEAWDRYRSNIRENNRSDAAHGEYKTVKFRGFSAAINMGPVALKGTRNHVDGAGEGGSAPSREHTEVNLSIAF